MKINVIRGLVILTMGLLLLSSLPIMGPTEALGQSSKKVLMIPREGYSQDLDLMIKMEVGVMTLLLKNAGFEVDIATTSGYPIIGPTQKIEKLSRLSEINLDNYAGIIMPCMAVGLFPGPPVAPEAVAAVKKALADGKPIAASANSAIILADAGVLKGKKYAFVTNPLETSQRWTRKDLRFEGAIYSGPGVVQDGQIITSGICPRLEIAVGMQSGVVELTQKFIAAIKLK
jgi:putative intracellular protease/amidase